MVKFNNKVLEILIPSKQTYTSGMTEYFEKSILWLCSFINGTAATKKTDGLKKTSNNLETFCEDHLARIPL